MSRVVVRMAAEVEEDGREIVKFSLDQAPADVPDPGRLYRFPCQTDEILGLFNQSPPQHDVVRQVGESLMEKLSVHPAVKQALAAALGGVASSSCPIYLRLSSEDAAAIPWETLFDPRLRFLALDGRWPIARITDFLPTEPDVRYFAPPLRLLAALSATGVDAAQQWEHLRDAVLDAPLQVQLRVVIGQPQLYREISQELDGLGDERLSVLPLAGKRELLGAIARFDPHILHVFSHGRGDYSPRLELATPQDHALGRSSVLIEPGELRGLARSAWLVVLNCCRGGADAPDIRSLAYQVVGARYPAVLGMREPITESDGHLITGAYYPALLDRLAKLLLPLSGDEVEIDWAADLHGPRQGLRDKYLCDEAGLGPSEAAARYRDWAVPVLYVRPEPLRVEGLEVDPGIPHERRVYLLTLLNELSRQRLGLHTDTPTSALAVVDNRIGEVKRELRDPS